MLPFTEQNKWLRKQLAYQRAQRRKVMKFQETDNE